MNTTIKKKLSQENKYYTFILDELLKLPSDKEYKLIDIGAADKVPEKLVPPHIKYFSLDIDGDYDYQVNLDKGKLPIKDKTFDIILCTETLEHVLYPHKIMEEIMRISKPEAIFILSMPNELNFYIRLQYLFNIKSDVQMPFQTIIKHGHIHTPRSKDIINFFSNYISIKKVHHCWYSRNFFINKGIKKKIYFVFDELLNALSKLRPSLFSRNVTVIGLRK